MSTDATAAVLIIGNEILSGKTRDANLQFLGESFARLGILLAEARVIRDEIDVIAGVVNELRARHTYVFTTGGIGPTHDDMTAEAVATAFGVDLVQNAEAVDRIRQGGAELNAARLKMARIPEGAGLIDNPISRAPGFRMENVFVLAGIPSVARAMFSSIEHELVGGEPIRSASIDLHSREGDFAAALQIIAEKHSEVEIGSYPFVRDGRFGASIVVRGRKEDTIELVLREIRATLADAD